MPFQIVRNDITRMHVDAIVNAAKPSLLGGGGVDGAIHAAAGPGLLAECAALGGCETGQARITGAYRLSAKYVIHTVGPQWQGGGRGERALLTACYRSSLALAREHGCESVAFPLISAGIYGYPKEQAMEAAVEAIRDFLRDNDMTVYLVVYGPRSLLISQRLYADVREYIDDHYIETHPTNAAHRREECKESAPRPEMARPAAAKRPGPGAALGDGFPARLLDQLDESFQQMLLREIDRRGMTDVECYKRANIDRKLFSKIRKDVHYRPSKPTALAFAVALRLNLEETESLLRKAGFALSRSSRFDVIVRYFIERGDYDIFKINEVLFQYDQSLLGG